MNEDISTSDEQLMVFYKEGNFSAFEELYRRYDQQILGFLIRQTNYREQDAQEIAQEVWLSLIRTSANYQVQSSFRTYIFTIVHHKYIDFYRRTRTQSQIVNLEDDNFAEKDDMSVLEENIIRDEHQRIAEEILSILPDHHREILVYRYVEELSVPEIAAILKIPLERAKSKLRYAKASFKEAYERYEGSRELNT